MRYKSLCKKGLSRAPSKLVKRFLRHFLQINGNRLSFLAFWCSLELKPSVLIGSFLVRILPKGPFCVFLFQTCMVCAVLSAIYLARSKYTREYWPSTRALPPLRANIPTTALRLQSSIKYSTINNQKILPWFIEEILMETFIWCLVFQKYFRLFFDLIQGRGAIHTTTNFEGNKFNLVTFLYTYLDRICHYSRILYSTIIVFYDPQRKYFWTSYNSPNYLFNCYNFVMVIW